MVLFLQTHQGMLGGGHYVTFACNPNGKWYCYNDSSCKVSAEQLSRTCISCVCARSTVDRLVMSWDLMVSSHYLLHLVGCAIVGWLAGMLTCCLCFCCLICGCDRVWCSSYHVYFACCCRKLNVSEWRKNRLTCCSMRAALSTTPSPWVTPSAQDVQRTAQPRTMRTTWTGNIIATA